MRTRSLGPQGPEVSALGFGLMSLSGTYGPSDDAESLRAMHTALDLGIGFFDTAEMYGGGHNERLAAQVLAERRDEIFLATKFGIFFEDGRMQANGRPENARRAVDGSLERLGIDQIDLYYLHRVDPNTPIEDTVGAMAELVKAGKVRFLGLSECSAATLRRAGAVHPITAVQSEYSLFSREVEDAVLPACQELGVGFVPYSPLGRGFLTGSLRSADALEANDFRRMAPRLQGENFEHNFALVERIEALARARGVSAAQLALAWVLRAGEHVVPLFGTRREANLRANAGAVEIELSAAEVAALEQACPRGAVKGASLSEGFAHLRETDVVDSPA